MSTISSEHQATDLLKHTYRVPEALMTGRHTEVLKTVTTQYNLWKKHLPEAYKHYFHDTNELIPSSSYLAQKVNAFWQYWTGQPEFKLPFDPSCWSTIYNATEAQLKEDANLPPLHFAIKYQCLDMVKALLQEEGVDSVFQLKDENATVHFAATQGDPDFYVELMKMGCYKIDLMTGYLFTNSVLGKSLRSAAKSNYVRVIPALIKAGADVNAKNKRKQTPLHGAAIYGSVDSINVLASHGANINAKDKDGVTPLLEAAISNRPNVIRTLVELGADINTKDNNGNNPFHFAAGWGLLPTIRTLVELGANNINAKNKKGITPLHCSVSEGHIDATRTLVELGANINAKNNFGNTPLHKAAIFNWLETTPMLVELGADIHAKNNDGKTPLHKAAEKGSIYAISTLTSLGADLYAPLPDGRTIFDGYPDIDFSQAVENYNLFNATRLSSSVRAARCEALFIHSNSPKTT